MTRTDIVDIDEIAALVAVGDAVAVRLEQLHGAARLDVVEAPRQHAHHRALVIFIGAEHVEEFQARPLRRQLLALGRALGDGHVEQMLAPAVQIHRPQRLQRIDRRVVAKSLRAVAIGRRRRGIDQRRCVGGAPVEQPHRQAKIGFDHQIAVGRGGLRDRAEMDDRRRAGGPSASPSVRAGGTMSASCRLARLRHLPSWPRKSQTATSLRPASFNAATTFDPIKPAPPVTSNMTSLP